MQRQTIEEVEAAKPAYVVFVNVQASWLYMPTSSRPLVTWLPEFLKRGYHRVGGIDIISGNMTRYLWGPQAASYTPTSDCFVTVFKRY